MQPGHPWYSFSVNNHERKRQDGNRTGSPDEKIPRAGKKQTGSHCGERLHVHDPRREAGGFAGSFGVRKEHDAEHDLRAAGTDLRRDFFWGQQRDGTAVTGKGCGHGVSELCTLSPYDGGAEHPVPAGEFPGKGPAVKRGHEGTRAGSGEAGAHRGAAGAKTFGALGRPAAAGGHCPFAGEAAQSPASG